MAVGIEQDHVQLVHVVDNCYFREATLVRMGLGRVWEAINPLLTSSMRPPAQPTEIN